MPWEDVGSCGNGQLPHDSGWIAFCYRLGVQYVKFVLGEPPEGCSLDVHWQDHEYGSYPSIGLHWDFPALDGPWNYLHRAEDLLREFDNSIEWGKLFSAYEELGFAEATTNPHDANTDSQDEDIVENETAMDDHSYFGYKERDFYCEFCGWRGKGESLLQGELHNELLDVDCPDCHATISFISYPTYAEAAENQHLLSSSDKQAIANQVDWRERAEASLLKSTDELPEITEDSFVLFWDHRGGNTIVRLGDREIFKEAAYYEGFERFEIVARILKQRYGDAIKDLIPTEDSYLYLLGDSMSAGRRVTDWRRQIFGAEPNGL